MGKIFESPLVSYLVIGSFSLLAAGLMFLIGGSLAEVSNQENTVVGISFKAGGPIAGFIIVFWVSLKVIEQLRKGFDGLATLVLKVPVNDKLPLDKNPSCFSRDQQYACTYGVFNTETGDSNEFQAEYTWEAGHLTVYVRKITPKDRIMIRVTTKQSGSTWESDHFDLQTLPTLIKPL